MSHRVAIACLCVAISACSPALVQEQGKVAGGQVETCKMVTPTGSNYPRRVCSTASEREEQRGESQRTLEQRVFRPNGGAGDKPASSL
jgi:hypothetical protein